MPNRASSRQPAAPRNALVTGGARRLGREFALALAADGWDIAVHYGSARDDAADTVRRIRALGRRAVAVKADLSSEIATRKLFERGTQALGPISCLVNNAAVFEHDSAADFTTAALLSHMKINCAAPLLLAQALHAALPKKLRGVVINLLDQKLWNPNPDFLSYTMSKSALKEATTLLAQALAPRVRVVGIAPGITLPSHLQDQAAFERSHKMAPLGRSSTAADIAAAVVYLAGADAVTGTTLLVDGGQHLVPLQRDFSFL